MTPKTVLITGCSAGGIGSALAEVFQKRGIHNFATARDLSKMSHLQTLSHVTLLKLDPGLVSKLLSKMLNGRPEEHLTF